MEIVQHLNKLDEGDPLRVKALLAIQHLKRAFALYGEDLALSFNGGKDSTVVLHLLRAAASLAGGSNEEGAKACRFQTFFFPKADDFKEITDFVEETAKKLGLEIKHFINVGFKEGVGSYKAIVLGTRHGDPNAHGQETFCPSSEGWPPFMRINPVLDWSYSEVWRFLRECQVEYCSLYDLGFTSIGSTKDTVPNANLLISKEEGTYEPAYKLVQGEQERAGRT
jgi:FAD synthetase